MANIDQLSKRRGALDARVDRPQPSETQRRHVDRDTMDFLQALSEMQEGRRYHFALDTIEGIYTTVEHAGYVTAGQRRAINNIRQGCGEEEI